MKSNKIQLSNLQDLLTFSAKDKSKIGKTSKEPETKQLTDSHSSKILETALGEANREIK